ncbi:hypothetical protein DFP72DRAFT_840286 [Ephemerocybe angulata]|uniref:Uncharacterized protein n=1 Tax=Ephemerocybe angulata TaxID=980116 RepID=A0A8H6MCH9_9AGAR|nr:hypothetical protein DFP72DRAFT_840286 [Tulosesus angulatus]
MMLVQKPPAFSLAQPPAHYAQHRRHPSAPPAVVVQPTRTPGLLYIAKPAKATPQRQLQPNQRKEANRTGPKPKVARAPALLNPAEITDKKPALVVLQAPVSPTPVRGRVVPKQGNRERTTRSKHGRQPSPPVELQPFTPSSQAEVIISTNQFNPFLDSKQQPAAIPVPKAAKPQHQQEQHQLARSDPTTSHMRSGTRKGAHKARFPVCDDVSEVGDSSDTETPSPVTPPATPLRKHAQAHVQSAPPVRHSAAFPFNNVSPQQQNKGRRHRRSPSEGVFNMSFSSDEDVTSGSGNALLTFARSRAQQKVPTTPSPSLSRATAVALFPEGAKGDQQTALFYASSLFQNSPSPDELPDLSFFED